MRKVRFPAVLGALLSCAALGAAPAGWDLAYEDTFSRRALGTQWLILRGDWHINSEGRLQIQRQWPSHSFIACTVPLRGRNVRVEFDATIPGGDQAGTFGAFLQAGALGWGAGGIDDRVGVEVVGVTPDKLAQPQEGRAPSANVLVDVPHRFAMSLVDGRFEVKVDDKPLASGAVPQGRSLLNSGLQFSAVRGARVDNLRIYTAPMKAPPPEVNGATPEENRRATVFAEKHLDPARPDCGLQAAIDSLPPGGGVVILPKGRFLLRRFLDVPSHVTLAGQGPETLLQVIDVTSAPIESVSSEKGVHRLVLKGDHDFRPGDAFAYDGSWGHPINSKAPGQKGHRHMLGGGGASENRLLVLAADGRTLTVNAPPPAGKGKSVCHFFPAVCSYESEFAEVRDLKIVGPAKNPAGARGGFMTNPVTFGVTSNPRFTRLVVENWPADGISAQGADDARFFDNTISGVGSGLHPGTTTLRVLAARNLSVDRSQGLFFCWYNSHGVHFRNHLSRFGGYPDSGDVFNTLACNRLDAGIHVTVGYNGCLFANHMQELTIFGSRGKEPHDDSVLGPGGRSYDLPPRYFTIACNIVPTIKLYKYAQGNAFAGNVTPEGHPAPIVHHLIDAKPADEKPVKNIIASDPPAPIEGLPEPIARTSPEPPPPLAQPVLDGREFYRPDAPDCGFQAALDSLAEKGGTLLLPGGRYALAQPLRVPSRVTLAGYGTGTVLLPAGPQSTVIVVRGADGVTIRDLAVEGPWSDRRVGAEFGGAVWVVESKNVSLVALDIRGWSSDGIGAALSRDVAVRDCRMLRCVGAGLLAFDVAGLQVESTSAVQCRDGGFVIDGERGARLTGNIAALNNAAGYLVRGEGALIVANNADNNLGDGIRVENARQAVVAGNTCAGNNQSGGDGAGIRVGRDAVGTRVLYNDCGDEQLYATQLVGIREDESASKSEIRFNVTATVATRRGHEKAPSLVATGKESVVADNWTDTILPSNDSIESLEWMRTHPKTK